MPEWTFITNHGLVLTYISKRLHSTAREIATAVNITERTTRKIIADLEAGGYIERQKVGRNNAYRTNPFPMLRHEITRDVMMGDLLKVLGLKRGRKRSSTRKATDGH